MRWRRATLRMQVLEVVHLVWHSIQVTEYDAREAHGVTLRIQVFMRWVYMPTWCNPIHVVSHSIQVTRVRREGGESRYECTYGPSTLPYLRPAIPTFRVVSTMQNAWTWLGLI